MRNCTIGDGGRCCCSNGFRKTAFPFAGLFRRLDNRAHHDPAHHYGRERSDEQRPGDANGAGAGSGIQPDIGRAGERDRREGIRGKQVIGALEVGCGKHSRASLRRQ